MLEINNLVVEYNNDKVIGPFNLKVKSNNILGIIGQSGAGKTTIVKAITDTILLKSGSISFNDKPIDQDKVMYITQKGTLFNHLTVRDNLRLTSKDLTGVEEILVELNLDETYMEKYPFELSGGEAQRIDLIRAILSKSDIIIFDEAFHALDSNTKDDTYNLIRKIKEEYKILIIFITHDILEAYFLSTHIAVVEQGEIKYSGTFKDLINEDAIKIDNLISKEKQEILKGI